MTDNSALRHRALQLESIDRARPGGAPWSPRTACSPICCACARISEPACERRQATAFAPASARERPIRLDILGLTRSTCSRQVHRHAHGKAGSHDLGFVGRREGHPARTGEEHRGPRADREQDALKLPFGFDASSTREFPGFGSRRFGGVGRRPWSRPCAARPAALETRTVHFRDAGRGGLLGSLHVDKHHPSLFGGLVLTVGIDNPRIKQIPIPNGIRAILGIRNLFLSTRRRGS